MSIALRFEDLELPYFSPFLTKVSKLDAAADVHASLQSHGPCVISGFYPLMPELVQ